ncbi:hypothetical protein GCM10009839_52250 [Catenulispora yoronensis]|uniref:Aminoglycoside phosphotransferase domain-containing protein n=1 Tax=Catenulispora yoronensis TaxID=450799 RepID=A0ABN2USP5_9ACTN
MLDGSAVITAPARFHQLTRTVRSLGLGALTLDSLTRLLGRNENWTARTDQGFELFLKRLTGPRPAALRRFRRSAAFQATASKAGFRSWRSPEYLGGDEQDGLLVFRALTGAVGANTLVQDDRFHTSLSRRMGRGVGELHACKVAQDADAEQVGGIGGRLQALTLAEYAEASGGELEVWTLMQHDKPLRRALEALDRRTADAPKVPSHGDLRLDQFLLVGADELHITDWEEFSRMDAAVDLGSLVGEWLHRAATLMFADVEFAADQPAARIHEDLVAKGERELERIRPFVSAFWSGYLDERGPVDPDLAVRVTAHAGWHLFDRMMAGAMVRPYLSTMERGIAGIGRNALINPDDFVETIGLIRDGE